MNASGGLAFNGQSNVVASKADVKQLRVLSGGSFQDILQLIAAGGGGSSGLTEAEVNALISAALATYYDQSQVDAALALKQVVLSNTNQLPQAHVNGLVSALAGVMSETNGAVTIDSKLFMGRWPFNNNYHIIGHADLDHAQIGNYGFRCDSSGQTRCNAASNQMLQLCNNNVAKAVVHAHGLSIGNYSASSANALNVTGRTRSDELLIASHAEIGDWLITKMPGTEANLRNKAVASVGDYAIKQTAAGGQRL